MRTDVKTKFKPGVQIILWRKNPAGAREPSIHLFCATLRARAHNIHAIPEFNITKENNRNIAVLF